MAASTTYTQALVVAGRNGGGTGATSRGGSEPLADGWPESSGACVILSTGILGHFWDMKRIVARGGWWCVSVFDDAVYVVLIHR